MHPSLTRSGVGYSHYLPVTGFKIEDFLKSKDDLWLPPMEVAAKELGIFKNLAKQAIIGVNRPGFNSLESCELNEDTGCWMPDVGMNDSEHTETLWGIAEYDARGVLNLATLAVKQQIQLCDGVNCLNPRHYDFTPRLRNRWELLEPDERLFKTLPDGRIQTAWGSILPSIEESIEELRKLQRACHPYESEKTGALTANSVSKITIDEHTGCWPVRSYYTRLDGFNSQVDGYGRLYPRITMRGFSHRGDALAHRVAWVATGRSLPPRHLELNHVCGFRPCANPLHMEIVHRSDNINHSYEMRNAIDVQNFEP